MDYKSYAFIIGVEYQANKKLINKVYCILPPKDSPLIIDMLLTREKLIEKIKNGFEFKTAILEGKHYSPQGTLYLTEIDQTIFIHSTSPPYINSKQDYLKLEYRK